jgi:hypothetical protein
VEFLTEVELRRMTARFPSPFGPSMPWLPSRGEDPFTTDRGIAAFVGEALQMLRERLVTFVDSLQVGPPLLSRLLAMVSQLAWIPGWLKAASACGSRSPASIARTIR